MNYFLITGMARSGTTLLEKLLASHPQVDVLPQPIPLLYRHLKKKFYENIGYPERYYVLNNLFNERKYSEADFVSFLNNCTISSDEMKVLIAEMKDWSGQSMYFPDWDKRMGEMNFRSLSDLYQHLVDGYGLNEGEVARGTKEILIEEFIPYFIKNDINVIVIVRDPRDVITSLNIGRGPNYGGKHRPTLFHLRNWRKSIALINTYVNDSRVLVIRYEDLIQLKPNVIKKITDFLGVDNLEPADLNRKITNRNGEEWTGNSSTGSFNGINKTNKGKYKNYLSSITVSYIEFFCKVEMECMGYKLENYDELSDFDPTQFQEEYEIENVHLDPAMSTTKNEIEAELKRKELLKTSLAEEEDVKAYYYSMINYQTLKSTVVNN